VQIAVVRWLYRDLSCLLDDLQDKLLGAADLLPVGREVVVAQSTEDVTSVMEKMKKYRCRHMPVIAGEQVVGFLSLRDLLFADIEEKDAQVQQLNSYVYYSPENPAGKSQSD